MHMAHILSKHKPGFSWSDMLRYGWYFVRFREALRKGVVKFSYFKKDGSIREAKGTLNLLLLPEDKLPHSGLDPDAVTPADTFAYYDLDAAGWRSFRIDNFIGFVEQVKSV